MRAHCFVSVVAVLVFCFSTSLSFADSHSGPWPGLPSADDIIPPPMPTVAVNEYGGPARLIYQSPAWVPTNSNTLVGSMTESRTNDYPSNENLNCPIMPNTGVTRSYDFHVAYQTIAPDGIERHGITINGQFPGPLIEADW